MTEIIIYEFPNEIKSRYRRSKWEINNDFDDYGVNYTEKERKCKKK